MLAQADALKSFAGGITTEMQAALATLLWLLHVFADSHASLVHQPDVEC